MLGRPARPTAIASRFRRLLAALAVALGVVLLAAAPASAHAELLASNPYDGSIVPVQPEEITLQFSEKITVQADGIRVLDGAGHRVDRGRAASRGQEAVAPVRDGLSPGTYVVAWRVVSADGHPVRGAFTFSVKQRSEVGTSVEDRAFAASADKRDEIVGAVLRYLTLIGILGASGMVLVGARLRRTEDPGPTGPLTAALAIAGIVGLIMQVPLQAALATGQGWGSITQQGVLALALDDGVGWALAVSAVGLLALLVTYGLPWASAPRVVALVGAVAAPMGLAITGHTRTMSPAAVAFAADAVHALAGAVWFGGLIALLHVVRARRRDRDDVGAADAVRQFSGLALVAVAAVAVAGGALAWIEIGSLDALTSTTYGRLLLVKVALVVVVVALGAWNRQRIIPGLPAADAPEGRGLVKILQVVAVEVLVLCLVLATTAVLTNVTPAKAAAKPGIATASAPLGSGTMDVTVDPAVAGRNDVHVYIKDRQGRADTRYKTASFRLSLPAQQLGPIAKDGVKAGPGHFQLVGAAMQLPGEWTITVIVQPDRFTETRATVRVTLR